MNDKYIKQFYTELNQTLDGDYKIILEPPRLLADDWIEYDSVKWELDGQVQNLVTKLLKDDTLSFEEKLLNVYKHICLNYIYDDNVLYFFKRDCSNPNNIKYIAVDWYGRIVDNVWLENRKKHNRRICYEFSRLYAKAINELLDGNNNLEAFMVGDKENLHYIVGLTGKDYSLLLDQDDFNSIKDLTRLKLGLTLKGIKILRDDTGIFQEAIDNFNKDKLDDLVEVEEITNSLKDVDTIMYLNEIIKVLKSYNIDSQGFMEYMRSKIEQENIEIEKIWKESKGRSEKRYVRCLLFNFDSKTYLLDSIEQTLTQTNKEDLDTSIFIFNPEENYYPYYGG